MEGDGDDEVVVSRGKQPEGASSNNGRSKPRASLACSQCRVRKTKCVIDPIRNTCSSCRALQVPCTISRDGDRRKVASREQISSLQDRLRYLESVVARQAAVGAPPIATDEPAFADDNTIESASERRPSHTGELLDDHAREGAEPNEDHRRESMLSFTGADVRDDVFMGPMPPTPAAPRTMDGARVPGNAFAPNMSRLTPPSEPDSARLDVDEESSQPLFYGPTSQRYIHTRHLSDCTDVCFQTGQNTTLVNLDSHPVRTSLLQTFWKAQPLSQSLVDQGKFEAGRRVTVRSKYFSDFLENSMLACATRMSTSPDIRAFGAKYADKASAAISLELQDPNIAGLQGFLLLSDYEATRGRNRLGYMYCGIGCRMAFDLGLHEDCSGLIAKGKMAPDEAFSRHLLLLGAHVYDKLWALYLGRPSTIPNTYLNGAQHRKLEQGWHVPPTLEAWVDLAATISEVAELLNCDSPIDEQAFDRLHHMDVKISAQCASLPPSLALDESQISDLPAAAYGFHIQYRGIRIVLHRLLSKALIHGTGRILDRTARVEHSRIVMRENAICIARLVSVYQQIFGIENVITVMLDNMFVAAALLVSYVLRSQQHATETSTTDDVRWISCLAEMLQNAQKHYPVTARMRSTLSALVVGTSLAGAFGSWADLKKTPQSSAQFGPPMMTDPFAESPFGHAAPDPQDLFFTGPFEDAQGQVPQHMDTANMMSWMLSPMD